MTTLRTGEHGAMRAPGAAGARGAAALAAPLACAAECTWCARLGATLFRHRGWLPLLVLGVPLCWPARAGAGAWAAGLLLLLAGEAVRLSGVAVAGQGTRRYTREVPALVTHGVFAVVRNPLYVGNLLAWLGFGCLSGALWFLPFAALLFALEYGLIVRWEEGVLESHFGAPYLAYRRRVPRWLPRWPGTAVRGPHDWAGALASERTTFLVYALLLGAFALKRALLG